MDNIEQQFLAVIAYSETMLKAAEAGNWEEVIDTETRRRHHLEKLFSPSFSEIDTMKNKKSIQQILLMNEQLEVLASKVRNEVRQQAGTVNKGRHAIGVYAQHTG